MDKDDFIAFDIEKYNKNIDTYINVMEQKETNINMPNDILYVVSKYIVKQKTYFQMILELNNKTLFMAQDIKHVFNKMKPLLKFIKQSVEEEMFDAENNAFFVPPKSELIQFNSTTFQIYDELFKKENIVFNKYLLFIYFVMNNTKKQIVTNKFWTLFSLDEIYNYNTFYKNTYNQNTWVPIGMVYCGLGHIDTLRMDIRNGELFFQPDGGSNGYEREAYHNQYITQIITPNFYSNIDVVLDTIISVN